MNKVELEVNRTPIIFTGNSVTYDGKEFFYNKMSAIKHIVNDTPAIIFTYDDGSVQIPYDPDDKSIMDQIVKEIITKSESTKDAALSPSPEEFDAIFSNLETPKQTPPSPPPLTSQQKPQQSNYRHPVEDTMTYDKTKLCGTCGKRIAKSIKRCPYCGAKNDIPIFKRWWFIVLCILVVLVVAGAIGGDLNTDTNTSDSAKSQKETTVPKEEVLTISPDDLLTNYEENEVKGDELYVDKKVRLTGTVNDIGKDLAEEVYITFKTKNEFSITAVQCYFSDDKEIRKVMKLKPNQQITVVGRCTGKFANVFIKDCIIE